MEVTGAPPLLATADASLGQVVDERRVLELPLFSGNAMEFELMAPGAVNTTDMRLRKAPFNNAPSQFSTDGGGTYNNEFTIDGVPNTFSDSTQVRVAFSPPQASIGEFKVQTSMYDAGDRPHAGFAGQHQHQGRNERNPRIGLVVDSQQEVRHAHDFPEPLRPEPAAVHRTTATAFRPAARVYPQGLQRQEPDLLAVHLGGQQVRRSQRGRHYLHRAARGMEQRRSFRPAEARRQPTRFTIPRTIAAAPDGRFSRTPFVGNIIPANRIDPIAKNILALYPLPNQAGTTDGRNNYFTSGRTTEDYWTTIGRFDHAFSEKDRMFIRVHRDFWLEDKNHNFLTIRPART